MPGKLINGECLEEMQGISPKSIDLVLQSATAWRSEQMSYEQYEEVNGKIFSMLPDTFNEVYEKGHV